MLQGSCDVDVVDAHARAADNAQPTSGAVLDRGSAEHRRRAHDDGVEILQAAAGELGVGEVPIYDFRAGLLEQLHRRGREPVSDEDGGYGRRGEDQERGCNEGEHPLTTSRFEMEGPPFSLVHRWVQSPVKRLWPELALRKKAPLVEKVPSVT